MVKTFYLQGTKDAETSICDFLTNNNLNNENNMLLIKYAKSLYSGPAHSRARGALVTTPQGIYQPSLRWRLTSERQRDLKKLSDPVGSPDFLEILRDATRLFRPPEPLEGGHIQQFAATQVQLLVFISIILKWYKAGYLAFYIWPMPLFYFAKYTFLFF